MTKRVVIADNFFGAGNFGDDLMLAGFVAVSENYPELELMAFAGHDSESQRRRFPMIRWFADDSDTRNVLLRDADAWLCLGDTPFQLDSGDWAVAHNERERARCAFYQTPMYMLGVGCESAQAVAEPRSQKLLQAVQHVWARDEASYDLLTGSLDSSRLTLGADLAHLVFDDEAPERENGVLGMIVAFEQRDQFDLREIEQFLCSQSRGETRWITQEVRDFAHVERWLLNEMSIEARSLVHATNPNYTTCTLPEYLEQFGAPEVVITSRYHGALVAAWQGSRVLVVTRSPKLGGIAREFGLATIENMCSASALETALSSATVVARDRLYAARSHARTMCDAFCSLVAAG